MQEQIKNIKPGDMSLSLFLSILIHCVIFFLTAYIINLQFDKPVINSVYLTFQKNGSPLKTELKNESVEKSINPEESIKENIDPEFYSFSKDEYDTSDIRQIYKESTLNVSVRYPNGWTYLDQNVKNKLDGVTFWSVQNNFEIPLYIHLDVQEKYIFNPLRYKNNLEHKENIFYYNDPEELEGYITQIIYIRTETDEDYSLKLMVKGKETFKSFQPVFFNMAKSLKFGKSFF